MDKKRMLRMNVLVIALVLLLTLVLFLASEAVPRKITPNAGILEGFEPAVTTQSPADD